MAQRTYVATKKSAQESRSWFVVDATNIPLGRLASEVARVLRGKHKPTFTPHEDTGDFVIVVNASKVKLTGRKLEQKKYYHHTGFPGGIKEHGYDFLIANEPELPVRKAVWGMIPKGPLGRKIIKKLKVYGGPSHDHSAQQPKVLEVK